MTVKFILIIKCVYSNDWASSLAAQNKKWIKAERWYEEEEEEEEEEEVLKTIFSTEITEINNHRTVYVIDIESAVEVRILRGGFTIISMTSDLSRYKQHSSWQHIWAKSINALQQDDTNTC